MRGLRLIISNLSFALSNCLFTSFIDDKKIVYSFVYLFIQWYGIYSALEISNLSYQL